MPVKKPLRPQKIKLPSGQTRTLYRDYDGTFISKAKYLSLRAKLARAPTAKADQIAAKALQRLVKLIERKLPLLDRAIAAQRKDAQRQQQWIDRLT